MSIPKEEKRKRAREFLYEFSARIDWFVLDTETTGPDRDEDEIVEIAVLDSEGSEIIDCLVRPTCEISDGAKEVHGIGAQKLKGCPSMKHLHPNLTSLLCRETVLIYNRSFDGPVIENSFSARSIRINSNDWDLRCVMEAYAMAEGEWSDEYDSFSWVSLEQACRERGVSFEGTDLHRAAGDAELTRRLVRSFSDEHEPESAVRP